MQNQPKCILGNYAQILCATEGCKQTPFICSQSNGKCQCINAHQKCSHKIHIGSLSVLIQSKRKSLSPEIFYRIDELIFICGKIISEITEEYYKLLYHKEILGFNSNVVQLIQILKAQQYNKLSGNYLNFILNKNQDVPACNSIEFLTDSAVFQQNCLELLFSIKKAYRFTKQFFQMQNITLPQFMVVKTEQEQKEPLINEIQIMPIKDQYVQCEIESQSQKKQKSNKNSKSSQHSNQNNKSTFQKPNDINNQQELKPFKFSENLKGRMIRITQNRAQQFKNNNNLVNTIALLQPNLSNTPRIWKIKVVNDLLCVGICLKNKIKNQNFGITNFSKIKHGVYMIGNFGFVLSHSDESINNKFLSFQFQKNDVIIIKYDIKNLKLKFQKEISPQTTYQMSIEPPPENDIYHPCIYLFRQGWSAQILN